MSDATLIDATPWSVKGTLLGDHPWIPGAVFIAYPGLAEVCAEAVERYEAGYRVPEGGWPKGDDFKRLANCANYLEDEDRPCTGTLRFGLGEPEAACDTCSARCGWLVADYRPFRR